MTLNTFKKFKSNYNHEQNSIFNKRTNSFLHFDPNHPYKKSWLYDFKDLRNVQNLLFKQEM